MKAKKRDTAADVVKAAMEWHLWLTIGEIGASYRKYCNAFNKLKRACERHIKASKP